MEQSRHITAVVLNYKTWQDAVNCVDSLLAQSYANASVVLVENGSPNDSYAQLSARYGQEPRVTLLKSEHNLGFARGNNLGIRYAHETLHSNLVFVTNSDTLLPPSLYETVAAQCFDGIGAATPTVHRPNGTRQPFDVNCDDIRAFAWRTVINLCKANIVALPLINRLYRAHKSEGSSDSVEQPKRYLLCGSAYFLTPAFFAAYRQLYPRTFLYWEEIDLLLYLACANLGTRYIETAPVVHLGGGVTQTESDEAVRKFRLKQSNRSMRRSLPLLFCRRQARILNRYSD